jgi:hypothetical protein
MKPAVEQIGSAEGHIGVPVRKPSGFDLRPRQPSDLTLVNRPGATRKEMFEHFRIASAPSDDLLIFVTRMRETAFNQ